MLTLGDINRALDRLGVEGFAPNTVRHAAREEHSIMNALRALAAPIREWRLRWIAKRRLRRLIRHDQIVSTVPLAPARRVVVVTDRGRAVPEFRQHCRRAGVRIATRRSSP